MAEETAEKCTLEHLVPKNPEICLDNSFILIQFSEIKYFKWISKRLIFSSQSRERQKKIKTNIKESVSIILLWLFYTI